jgi:ribulose-5-phosphate 4-epimerase/fuculose-1-phosphate aldolase
VSAVSHHELRVKVATACRVLGARRLVDGVLGHVSARAGDDGMLIRCRGPHERGVARSEPADIRLADLEGGQPLEPADGWAVPREWPIHAALYQARPEVGAVVHAHPTAAVLCSLAGLQPRPVFGAYSIPALRMALDGVPTYPRAILISRPELAAELLAAMGQRPVCVLYGHGIVAAGATVEQATVAALNLTELLSVTVALAQLGASPAPLPPQDVAELPDLGARFNDQLTWQSLVAELEPGP